VGAVPVTRHTNWDAVSFAATVPDVMMNAPYVTFGESLDDTLKVPIGHLSFPPGDFR